MATDLATQTPDLLNQLRQRIATPVNTAQPGAEQWAADPQYDATVRGIQQRIAGLGSDVDLQESRLRSDAQRQAQGLADTRDKTMQSLQEKLANQGILRSSINTEESGNVLNAYMKDYETLGQNEYRSLEDMARSTLEKVQGYNDQLSQAQADRAVRETARQQEEARQQAEAAAQKQQADQMRDTLTSLRDQLLKQLTPQTTPTGALTQPPPPIPDLKVPAIPTPAPAAGQPVTPTAPKANGDQIKEAQGILRLAGFDPGPMDGIAGAKTIAALNKYRTSHGLPATGTFSIDDYNALKAWMYNDQGFGGPAPAPAPNLTERVNNYTDAPWVGSGMDYIA